MTIFSAIKFFFPTDVEDLDQSVREKIPKNSHEAIQRIGNLLSHTPGSAGKRKGVDDRAFYGIGSKFGGGARRRKRFPTHKKPPHMEKYQNDEKVGCNVCKRDHLARDHHSREATIAAVRKKRSSERRALIAEGVYLDHKEEERDYENSNNDAEPDQELIADSESEDESDSSAFHAAVVDVNRASEVSSVECYVLLWTVFQKFLDTECRNERSLPSSKGLAVRRGDHGY